MIIVVCRDDARLLAMAQTQAKDSPQTFGGCFLAYSRVIPQLAVDENLFITAHGQFAGDDGNPVIGDQAEALYVNAVELLRNLQPVFPIGYRGSVFVSACESADGGRAGLSFVEIFKAQLQGFRPSAGKVFGQKGAVGYRVPPPDDKGWVQA